MACCIAMYIIISVTNYMIMCPVASLMMTSFIKVTYYLICKGIILSQWYNSSIPNYKGLSVTNLYVIETILHNLWGMTLHKQQGLVVMNL